MYLCISLSVARVHILFYELLCLQPEAEVRRLFTFLEKDFDGDIGHSLKRPSSLSRRRVPSFSESTPRIAGRARWVKPRVRGRRRYSRYSGWTESTGWIPYRTPAA